MIDQYDALHQARCPYCGIALNLTEPHALGCPWLMPPMESQEYLTALQGQAAHALEPPCERSYWRELAIVTVCMVLAYLAYVVWVAR